MKIYKCPQCKCKIPESMLTQAYGKNFGTCWNCGYYGEIEEHEC